MADVVGGPEKTDAKSSANLKGSDAGAPQQVRVQFIDRPDCPELFADSVMGATFDGQILRLEFTTTRLDEVKPNSPLTGRRYPVCRLVLTPSAAGELISRLQQISASAARAAESRAAAAGKMQPAGPVTEK